MTWHNWTPCNPGRHTDHWHRSAGTADDDGVNRSAVEQRRQLGQHHPPGGPTQFGGFLGVRALAHHKMRRPAPRIVQPPGSRPTRRPGRESRAMSRYSPAGCWGRLQKDPSNPVRMLGSSSLTITNR